MKYLNWLIILGSCLLVLATAAQATLLVQTAPAKTTGNKTVIKLALKNSGPEKIASVRATVFLLDAQGKLVGQTARWILGGTKDKPGLPPDAKAAYNFVVTSSRPFTGTRLMVNRIVLDNGQMADVLKDVTVEAAPDR